MKESGIMHEIMLALTDVGATVFRNNVGCLQAKNGQWVTYGVCNPGGSDLIGWHSTTITSTMVGDRVAVFAAIEVKKPGEKPTQDQTRFILAVLAAGGIATIADSVEAAIAAFPST